MYAIALADLIKQVRIRLDEEPAFPSDIMLVGGSVDDRNLDATIESLAVEAISSVHLIAPSFLLDGVLIDESGQSSGQPTVEVDGKGVADIQFSTSNNVDILRLVYFQGGDSDVACYIAYPENSMWGKAQKNKYLRGSKEHPFLIEMKDSKMEAAHYKYYTTKKGNDFDWKLCYFPKPKKEVITGTTYGFHISHKLELAVINYLTGLVLQTYEKNDAAQIYFTRAKDAMEQ